VAFDVASVAPNVFSLPVLEITDVVVEIIWVVDNSFVCSVEVDVCCDDTWNMDISVVVVLKVIVSVFSSVVLDCMEVLNNDWESVDRNSVLVICVLIVDDVGYMNEVDCCIKLVLVFCSLSDGIDDCSVIWYADDSLVALCDIVVVWNSVDFSLEIPWMTSVVSVVCSKVDAVVDWIPMLVAIVVVDDWYWELSNVVGDDSFVDSLSVDCINEEVIGFEVIELLSRETCVEEAIIVKADECKLCWSFKVLSIVLVIVMLEALTIVVVVSSCDDVGNVKWVVNEGSVDSYWFVENDDSSGAIDVKDASAVLPISTVEKDDDVPVYMLIAIVDSRK
jgi:hypothetical protein